MSILQSFSSCGCGNKNFVYDTNHPPSDTNLRITKNPDQTCQFLTKEAACCKGCGSSKCVDRCGEYGEEYTFTHPDGRKEKRVRPIPSGMYSCADVKCKDDEDKIEKREANAKTIIFVVSICSLVLMVILFLVLFQRKRR